MKIKDITPAKGILSNKFTTATFEQVVVFTYNTSITDRITLLIDFLSKVHNSNYVWTFTKRKLSVSKLSLKKPVNIVMNTGLHNIIPTTNNTDKISLIINISSFTLKSRITLVEEILMISNHAKNLKGAKPPCIILWSCTPLYVSIGNEPILSLTGHHKIANIEQNNVDVDTAIIHTAIIVLIIKIKQRTNKDFSETDSSIESMQRSSKLYYQTQFNYENFS